jgi:hypothetical protein
MVAITGAGSLMAQPYVLKSSSSVQGAYSWGSSFMPYQWYRNAECVVTLRFTESLAHPTYLNTILACSQGGLTSVVDVYIDTIHLLPIPQDSWVYVDGWWSNWHTRQGGYYVGRCTASVQCTLACWNIEAWISSHPSSDLYFIVFDQQGDGWDAAAYQTWLGPEGSLGLMADKAVGPRFAAVKTSALPNPFQSKVTLRYCLANDALISAKVYDANGQCVRTLVSGVRQCAGAHELAWDGLRDNGTQASGGTYFYRIEEPNQVSQGKLILQ